MYAEMDVKLDEALRLAKKAMALSANQGFITDTLGWVHFRRGEYRDAVKHLRRAAELSPKFAEIRYHLGMAHEKTGDRQAAVVEYRKALLLDPDDHLSRERLKALGVRPVTFRK